MPHNILAIPALNDNYIWTIVHPQKQAAVIIDPGEAKPVLDFLKQQKLNLAAILVTHHHWDHTNGIQGILQKHPAPVYGSVESAIPFCDHPIVDGQTFSIPYAELTFNVLAIPGHTLDHVAYYADQWVYTGDTLFAGGCGRIFEGSPDQFYHSLQKLASLDPTTRVYCGHEYTGKNLEFAETVEPDNPKLKQRIVETGQKASQNLPTLPSTLQVELDTNPFLRCHQKNIQRRVQEYCGYPLADTVAVFAALRRWKDEF
ncbi:hydroxyacylglutathione hydrolase [Coxiella burnetii]|uniref:hydroxyacylglutathione hydrolase n=1 Tax=Coxiella burnetii TaxID=777 RepID=UPI0000ED008C|nr:hydroxyacylglutathione hydrolase [Coxiella burnetii]ACJ19791.1 hydroxyacylglutathione hydrolase [Coxiella burnetii CbuK_Q154]ATN85626.1 hydroxyacylglutathione hydrolase [Coxiella burnetii str. Schperling]EAX32372.1 hydroxyacylglutathione hydrolase [Coxiella burnetii 'MSU Goat Q177']EDR35381.1 metallo-beta-lactamase family protein [Coxiella burnetii Q321]PHH57090.1 hydroxyacylglutathione hydrolase [Coxiella burnetii]